MKRQEHPIKTLNNSVSILNISEGSSENINKTVYQHFTCEEFNQMEYIKGIDEKCASRTLYNTENRLVFDPLCYEQRYIKASNILSHEIFGKRIKNILEFGVAELKFFVYIKNGLKHATRIDQVDIDGDLLERFKSRVIPLMCEHITRRERKLTARIWKGSVSVPNPNFTNVDAVVAIEL